MQSIASGIGSLDQDHGLDQTALEKPTAFLNHISVMKEGIQAMDKHHSEMQEAWEKMSHQCTTIQKNCVMSIKKGVNLFGNVLVQLRLIRNKLDEETRKMEYALKKVADKQSAKRV